MSYFRFVLTGLALSLGSYAMKYLFDLFQVPRGVSTPIEAVYTVVLVVFLVVLVVLTFRILTEGRRHTVR
jgi:SNF family Na+-dependent transporter